MGKCDELVPDTVVEVKSFDADGGREQQVVDTPDRSFRRVAHSRLSVAD